MYFSFLEKAKYNIQNALAGQKIWMKCQALPYWKSDKNTLNGRLLMFKLWLKVTNIYMYLKFYPDTNVFCHLKQLPVFFTALIPSQKSPYYA